MRQVRWHHYKPLVCAITGWGRLPGPLRKLTGAIGETYKRKHTSTHSSIVSLPPPLTHSLTHSPTHSLLLSLIHSPFRSFPPSVTRSHKQIATKVNLISYSSHCFLYILKSLFCFIIFSHIKEFHARFYSPFSCLKYFALTSHYH